MQVFKYMKSYRNTSEVWEIFNVVNSLKPYAISIYKSSWKDALDAAFFHIVENYNGVLGELEHYATKVVGTIDLQKYKKEFAEEDIMSTKLDSDTARLGLNNAVDKIVLDDYDRNSRDFNACVRELVVYFIRDYIFFKSGLSKNRKECYTDIFKKYDVSIIGASRDYLVKKYSKVAEEFLKFGDDMRFRVMPYEKIEANYYDSSEYKGIINDTVIIKRKARSHSKKIYRLDVENMIDILVEEFYLKSGYGKISIEGIDVYMTLSGKVVDNLNALKRSLELELINIILTRSNLKVLYRVDSKAVFFVSSKEVVFNIAIEAFNKEFKIELKRLVAKEVA